MVIGRQSNEGETLPFSHMCVAAPPVCYNCVRVWAESIIKLVEEKKKNEERRHVVRDESRKAKCLKKQPLKNSLQIIYSGVHFNPIVYVNPIVIFA